VETSKKSVETIKAEPTEQADETLDISDKANDSLKKDVKLKNIFKGFSLKKAFSSITKTLDEKPDGAENKDTNDSTSEANNFIPNDEQEKPLLKVDNPFKRFFAKNTLTTISTALDEDVEEITLLSDNKPVAEEVATPSKKRLYNRRMYYIIGLSFTFMSIVGLIFSIGFCVNVVKRFTDNTAQKEKFAKYIYPLVVTDMPPYESVGNLSDEHVITTAIWDLIMYGDLDKYENNFDVITVPAIDIEQHAAKLFGDNLTFNHKTFMASSINFYYDEEKKSYNIPTSPTYYSYIPQIEDIEKDGKKFTLLVAYKRDNPSWLTVREKESSNVSKYIEFVVLEEDNNYKILSMENVSSEHDVNSN
ncbi:MAG TPA: hypothetical protein GX710_01945, partial [Clostridiales bacterium]|nr:hypothetical protein [Clostridiales bacterium]